MGNGREGWSISSEVAGTMIYWDLAEVDSSFSADEMVMMRSAMKIYSRISRKSMEFRGSCS